MTIFNSYVKLPEGNGYLADLSSNHQRNQMDFCQAKTGGFEGKRINLGER
jgi:hypothetical protein